MKEGKAMNKYDRSRFYGPFPTDREVGYTDYPYLVQIDNSGVPTGQAYMV